jgi:hypothetical protein
MESTVRRYACEAGKNSRKIAESEIDFSSNYGSMGSKSDGANAHRQEDFRLHQMTTEPQRSRSQQSWGWKLISFQTQR